jgi:hypothetical protein
LGGDDRADACLVEQLGCERADADEDLALELGRFDRRRADPPRERAQDEPRRELVRDGGARAAEAAAALEQPLRGQSAELPAKRLRGGHDHAAQLHVTAEPAVGSLAFLRVARSRERWQHQHRDP